LRLYLESLRADPKTTEEELQAASTFVKELQVRETDANATIRNLLDTIRELRDVKKQLEADLDMAQDVNETQARLAANKVARMVSAAHNVKAEIKKDV
jgi:hypothetical protein